MTSVQAIVSIVIGLAFSLACVGWGVVLLRILPGASSTGGEGMRTVIGFLLGFYVYGAMLTFLALAESLSALFVAVLTAIGVVAFVALQPERLGLLAIGRSGLTAWKEASPTEKLLGILVVSLAVGFAASAWVRPPIGDAEAFYFSYAQLIASTGRLLPMPGYEAFSSIGLPAELQFAGLIALAGTPAAKVIIWPVALASALLLIRITTLCGGGLFARLIVAAILFTSTTFTHYIVDGKVDLVAAAFGMAALTLALNQWTVKHLPGCALIGFFAGAAAVAKFSYLVSLGPSLACVLLWRCHDGRFSTASEAWRETLRVFLLTGICAAIAWIPQLLKNAVLFEAPLAPFLGSPEDSYLEQVWFSPEVTLRIILSYPLALVFGRYPMQGGGLSFIMIAFAPLVLLAFKPRFRRGSLLAVITAAALAGTITWMILRPSIIAPRYILASLMLFIPIVACSAERVWNSWRTPTSLRLGMFLTVALACAASAWHLLPVPRAAALLLFGRLPPCSLASDYCKPLRVLNTVALPGDRVFFASHYSYWLQPELLRRRDTTAESDGVAASKNPVEELRKLGFCYFVADKSSHQNLVASVVPKLRATGAECVVESETVSVWRIPASSIGAPSN